MELHQISHVRIIEENVALIKELNEMRREIRAIKSSQNGNPNHSRTEGSQLNMTRGDTSSELSLDEYPSKNLTLIESLETHIHALELDILMKQERIKYLENLMSKHETIHLRPKSRHELPPLDAITGSVLATPQD